MEGAAGWLRQSKAVGECFAVFVTPEHGRGRSLEPWWGPFCDCDPGRHAGCPEPIFPSGMEQGSELFCCLEPENLVRGWSFSLENVPPVHTPHSPRLQGELLNAAVPLGPNTTSQGWPLEEPIHSVLPTLLSQSHLQSSSMQWTLDPQSPCGCHRAP